MLGVIGHVDLDIDSCRIHATVRELSFHQVERVATGDCARRARRRSRFGGDVQQLDVDDSFTVDEVDEVSHLFDVLSVADADQNPPDSTDAPRQQDTINGFRTRSLLPGIGHTLPRDDVLFDPNPPFLDSVAIFSSVDSISASLSVANSSPSDTG